MYVWSSLLVYQENGKKGKEHDTKEDVDMSQKGIYIERYRRDITCMRKGGSCTMEELQMR